MIKTKFKKNKNQDKIQTTSKKFTFFEKVQIYTMSSLSVVFFSFIIFAFSQNINNSGLMASVYNLNNNNSITAQFDSDIVLEEKNNLLNLIAGSKMENVDLIEGIIATNPLENLEISSKNPENSITKLGDGIYRFSINTKKQTIEKGTIIDVFYKNTDQKSEIIFTDTQFISNGIRYNLTNSIQ